MKNSIEDTVVTVTLKFVILLLILATFAMISAAFNPDYDAIGSDTIPIESYSLAGAIADNLETYTLQERAERACEGSPYTDCERRYLRRGE